MVTLYYKRHYYKEDDFSYMILQYKNRKNEKHLGFFFLWINIDTKNIIAEGAKCLSPMSAKILNTALTTGISLVPTGLRILGSHIQTNSRRATHYRS